MKLRSATWFGSKDRDGFIHRSWMKNQGHPDHLFDGRPVIGICNTWSELTPCNALFAPSRITSNAVSMKREVPLEFPVMSLGETLVRPRRCSFAIWSAWMSRKRFGANPIDGVILLAGCDKTTRRS